MREYEFICQKCNHIWYVTNKDIKESKKNKHNITIAKMNKFGFHTNKTFREMNAHIAQMQLVQA